MTRNVRVLAWADDVRVSQGVVTGTGTAGPSHALDTEGWHQGPGVQMPPPRLPGTNQSTGLHTHNQATSYPNTNGIKSEMIVGEYKYSNFFIVHLNSLPMGFQSVFHDFS